MAFYTDEQLSMILSAYDDWMWGFCDFDRSDEGSDAIYEWLEHVIQVQAPGAFNLEVQELLGAMEQEGWA